MDKQLIEAILEYNLNLLQLEMPIQALRKVMAKPEFRDRWLKVFKYYKMQGKNPAEAREMANRILGVR
jgi:capsid portal protein